MLGFDDYKNARSATTLGEVRKEQSDMIMEATWDGDVTTKTMYFFDYYHDPEPKKFKDLDMWRYEKLPMMRCKYLQGAYQSLDKDEQAMKLQMRPSQECTVPYYKEYFEDRYSAEFPVGLYCIIPNEKGIYQKWLVVSTADEQALQFPTYHILPCNYLLTWIQENKKQYMLGCLRNPSSYNSGDWLGHMIRIPEDQMKIIIPINRISEQIYSNQRQIIDAQVLTEPRTFRVSKVNRVMSRGVINITYAQDSYDPSTDYTELDENGNVLYFWADYYKANIPPQDEETTPLIRGEITTKAKPQIRLGGGFKELTINFYEGDKETEFEPGEWNFFIGEDEISDKLVILTAADSDKVELNQVKIKLPNDNNSNEDLLGKIMKCQFHSLTGVTAEYEISIVSL